MVNLINRCCAVLTILLCTYKIHFAILCNIRHVEHNDYSFDTKLSCPGKLRVTVCQQPVAWPLPGFRRLPPNPLTQNPFQAANGSRFKQG